MKQIWKRTGGIILLGSLLSVSVSFATDATDKRGLYGTNPTEILDTVAQKANKEYEIQETALNTANDNQGGYQKEYKIANTLDYLRLNIAPYLQWAMYIGLVIATILLIYNGFLMVTNAVHKQGDMAKVKTNITNIFIGVLILTGFYAMIKIAVGIINSVFGNPEGGSGF